VARTFEAGGSEDGVLYLPVSAAEALLALPGQRSVVLVRASGTPPAIERALAAGWLAGTDREAKALRRMSGAERELLRRLRALIGAITLLALATAALCTMSTLTDLVLERRREVGLLKALGASRREVIGLFLSEAAVLGAAGGLLGFGIGALAAQVVGRSVFHSAIRIDLLVLPGMVLLAVAVTLLSSLPPVRLALGVEPARVLRGD
jgi:putative ABC transport system permease protein